MTPEQREQLRHVLLELLAARSHTAPATRMLRRLAAAELDFKFSDEDLAASLNLLKDLGYARKEPDPLGATEYWQATASGVLAQERGA
jgi:hypothetical protein